MSTIVFVHAHPDDEASQTSGTMHLAARAGHRVVVVFATNGDHGDAPEDLADDETVVLRRRREAQASAEVVGTARVSWLGYADSGMAGWDQNAHDGSFHGADLDEAADRLVAVLDEEDADVLVTYDWHGGYGHPDHVKAHQVAMLAAGRAERSPRVLQSTMNRDALRLMAEAARAAGEDVDDWDPDAPMDDGNPFGTPEAELHWRVDVRAVLDVKRAALACHASQPDARELLEMPDAHFAAFLGDEWYVEPGRPPGLTEGPLVDSFG
ncbi:PIG-L deacetylase family protein [Ornithinimicrobium sp. LYQ121]|uniref:PIG-L deacetylase family protein n=1 Tax=Ornithinimicrobium sp. LYQ121 TaxID=3378801 RepID=UPI003851FD07